MNRTWTMLLAAAVMAALPPAAQADTAEVLTRVTQKASGALAMVNCKIEGQIAGQEGTIRGVGICVNASGGLFITLALDATTPVKRLKDFTLVLPGLEGKSIKAKLLAIDPTTGISFVKATEPHKWTEIGFAPTATLSVGQQVASVGLMGGDGGRTPYVGVGYVSAVFRVPGRLAYVTGGRLTGSGSPVFSADGRAVGIVGRQQLPMNFQMLTGRGSASVRLAARQETAFFLPVDEFVHVLRDRELAAGNVRRLPWLGAASFEVVGEELAGIIKLDRPGVMIDQVVPGHPADKAGLKNRDVIVAMDGKPLEKLATSRLVRDNFVRMLFRKRPGQTVSLTVLRGTKPQAFTVTLAQMPAQAHEAERYVQRRLGFIVREKVEMDRYRDRGPTAKVEGLIVIFVGPRTAGAAGGLRPGDLVTSCNDQPVKTVKAFQQIAEGAVQTKPNEAVNLLVRRGDQSMAVSIQVPKVRK